MGIEGKEYLVQDGDITLPFQCINYHHHTKAQLLKELRFFYDS